MKKKTEFSEYGEKNKLRVMDFVKAEKTPLYYDKKMTTVLLYMEYSEAFAAKKVNQELKLKMHALIDEAVKGFMGVVDTSRPAYNTILDNLNKIKHPDFAGNLMEAHECICMQLTVLKSISSTHKDMVVDLKAFFSTPIDAPGAHLILRKLMIQNEQTNPVKNITPVYSNNATIGFNTILFSVFNGFMPVGVGEKPHPVHDKWLFNQSIYLLIHDYGHSSLTQKSKQEDPETFEKYRKIYYELFEDLKQDKIDNKTFKKYILVLFFLVYDSAHSHPFANFKALEDSINQCFYLLLSDYKTPFEDLGYVIDKKNPQESLRKILLEAIQEFLMLHPELKVSPLAKPEEPVVPIKPPIPQIEPAQVQPAQAIELGPEARKNAYIIEPLIELLDNTVQNLSLALSLNTNNPNYRKFEGIMVKLECAKDRFQNKTSCKTILNSTMLAETLKDTFLEFRASSLLKRLLKTTNPSFDFEKEYAEAIKNVDARHIENTVTVSSHSIFNKKLENKDTEKEPNLNPETGPAQK